MLLISSREERVGGGNQDEISWPQVCYSVLQCFAVCSGLLQCVAASKRQLRCNMPIASEPPKVLGLGVRV